MPFRCVVGGRLAAREAIAAQHAETAGLRVREQPSVARWPFVRNILPDEPGAGPSSVWLPHLHRAFLSGQLPGTRLVLTQSTYLLQRWLDWLETSPGTLVVAHASRAGLKAAAPEAFDRRGPWSRIAIEEIEGDEDEEPGAEPEVVAHLRSAWAAGPPEDRLAACAKAIAGEPHNAALRLAVASVHMEIGSLPPAQEALDRALAIDAGWEAAWFEYGKLWLRADDLERAAERFAEAARLMPSFAAALSNLGAALGELDRPDDALAALRQALEHDPRGHLILNNIGVLCREQGQLDEAVRAGQDVIGLAPAFVFGYYNLAHALFLQGRFGESRDAYAEGVSRDAQRNPVQACRYAVSRAAAGETSAAIAQIRTLAAALPQELRDRVLGEAEETLAAVAGLGAGHAASVHEVQVAVRELATRRS